MTEGDVIDTAGPVTRAGLAADLARLGVTGGDVLIVHSSLSALGWVVGGAHAVVLALLDAVGPDGTVVVPTHSGQLSDPAGWERPPIPWSWWPTVRSEAPAYDPWLTPTRGMGAVVECLRRHPAARRSDHPLYSFAAVGRHRDLIVGRHPLDAGLGEGSPLAACYGLGARILLLGVGHANDTSLHLAEHRAAGPDWPRSTQGAPVLVDGVRRWATWDELTPDPDDFEAVGAALADAGLEVVGTVGAATARLLDQRAAVDAAVDWLRSHRRPA